MASTCVVSVLKVCARISVVSVMHVCSSMLLLSVCTYVCLVVACLGQPVSKADTAVHYLQFYDILHSLLKETLPRHIPTQPPSFPSFTERALMRWATPFLSFTAHTLQGMVPCRLRAWGSPSFHCVCQALYP